MQEALENILSFYHTEWHGKPNETEHLLQLVKKYEQKEFYGDLVESIPIAPQDAGIITNSFGLSKLL